MDVHVFRSRAHPGKAPWGLVYARRFVRPFAYCVLPVMIGALLAVLQGFTVLAFLTVGLPLAILIASGWTLYQMASTLAEIWVRPGAAMARTIGEYIRKQAIPAWKPIFELRTSAESLVVGLGDAYYTLARDDWPDADALLEGLRKARHAPFFAEP